MSRRSSASLPEAPPRTAAVTFLAVECLASCGTAPVMQVGETYHEQLDEAKVDRILEALP